MSQDAIMRLAIFLGLFAILAGIEHLAPRRPRPQKTRRWITNWIFVVVDTLTLRALAVILPFAAVFAAADASARGWGLLNLVALPGWVELVLVILVMDLAIWLQHLLSHKIPLLWRIHRVHHSDI